MTKETKLNPYLLLVIIVVGVILAATIINYILIYNGKLILGDGTRSFIKIHRTNDGLSQVIVNSPSSVDTVNDQAGKAVNGLGNISQQSPN